MHSTTRGMLVLAVALAASLVAPVGQAQKSALTRDVDNGAFQPVKLIAPISLNGATEATRAADLTSGNLFSVPTGKRFVVEYVAARAVLPAGSRAIDFGLIDGDSSAHEVAVPFVAGGSTLNGDPSFTGSQLARMYYDAGQSVTAYCFRSDTVGSPYCIVTIVGYLVTLPP